MMYFNLVAHTFLILLSHCATLILTMLTNNLPSCY